MPTLSPTTAWPNLAGWDEKLLSIELKALTEIELDFDI